MATVTGRISQIKQPYGGYLRLSDFEKLTFDNGVTLNDFENISGSRIGLVVDYLTRFYFTGDKEKAFDISLRGAKFAQDYFREWGFENAVDFCMKDISTIKEFDTDAAIVNACELTSFDAFCHNPFSVLGSMKRYGSPLVIFEEAPNEDTIQNIRTMLHRSASFFKQYGPVTSCGFSFESSGYTKTVNKGDGDFLTTDTLWDMKVYTPTTKITKKETLQILMYWIMGQHSGQDIFKNITKIGFFNPRLNIAYLLDVSKIDKEIIKAVERDVMCY